MSVYTCTNKPLLGIICYCKRCFCFFHEWACQAQPGRTTQRRVGVWQDLLAWLWCGFRRVVCVCCAACRAPGTSCIVPWVSRAALSPEAEPAAPPPWDTRLDLKVRGRQGTQSFRSHTASPLCGFGHFTLNIITDTNNKNPRRWSDN